MFFCEKFPTLESNTFVVRPCPVCYTSKNKEGFVVNTKKDSKQHFRIASFGVWNKKRVEQVRHSRKNINLLICNVQTVDCYFLWNPLHPLDCLGNNESISILHNKELEQEK